MRCSLLVPHVNDFDVLVETAVVDINNMPPAESENGLDTLGLQRARATRWPPLISVIASLLLECP
jgi:hypothetical protein